MEKVLILQGFSVFSVALKTSGNREGGKKGRKWVVFSHDNARNNSVHSEPSFEGLQ